MTKSIFLSYKFSMYRSKKNLLPHPKGNGFMKNHHILANQKGFSLITIVLLFTILAVMTAGGISLSLKLQAAGKNSKTVDKMTVINDALQKYYRGHQEDFPLLPTPIPTTHVLPSDSNNRIPVDALKLEQHFRYDAWGQFYYYDPGVVTDITDIEVDGKDVGAVIISFGPDQILEPGVTSPSYTTPQGDDILGPVNLREQAIEITLIEMRVIQKKLRAFTLRLCSTASTLSTSTAENWVLPCYDYFFTLYGLGDEFKQDAWLTVYDISTAGIRSAGPDRENYTSDDLFLSRMIVTCPGGLTPLPLAIAGAGFNDETKIEIDHKTNIKGCIGDVDIHGADLSTNTPDGSNSSLYFDGSDDYVDLGIDSPLLLNPGTGDYAISAWIKVDTNFSGTGVIYGTSHLSNDTTIEFSVLTNGSDNHLNFKLVDAAENSVEAESSINLTEYSPSEYWYHVVAVWESSSQEIKLYLNGKEDTNSTITSDPDHPVGNLTSDREYYIGQDHSGDGFNGLIDEVSIYNAAISADDVKNIYDASAMGGFSFKYLLNDTTATDISWHGNHGVITGTDFDEDRFGNLKSALLFNGPPTTDSVVAELAEPWPAKNGYSVMVWVRTQLTAPSQLKGTTIFNNEDNNIPNDWEKSIQIDLAPKNLGDPQGYRHVLDLFVYKSSFNRPINTDSLQLLAVTHKNTDVITYYNDIIDQDHYLDDVKIITDNHDDDNQNNSNTYNAEDIEFRSYTLGRNRAQDADKYFKGTISKVIIFARVLSPREIDNERIQDRTQ